MPNKPITFFASSSPRKGAVLPPYPPKGGYYGIALRALPNRMSGFPYGVALCCALLCYAVLRLRYALSCIMLCSAQKRRRTERIGHSGNTRTPVALCALRALPPMRVAHPFGGNGEERTTGNSSAPESFEVLHFLRSLRSAHYGHRTPGNALCYARIPRMSYALCPSALLCGAQHNARQSVAQPEDSTRRF
jgi:hypothetical protein